MTKMIVTFVFTVGVSGMYADKLSDFREANRYTEGCETIPAIYKSEREACEKEGPKVHEWCDGSRGPVTCINEEETRKPKRDIDIAKKTVSDLKKRRSEAESDKLKAERDKLKAEADKSNANSAAEATKLGNEIAKLGNEIAQLTGNIDNTGKTLETAEKALETRKKHVSDAIYNLDQCVAYRRAVGNSFKYALDRMRNENETPEIKKIAAELCDKYEQQKRGHEIQITSRTNALDNCKSWQP